MKPLTTLLVLMTSVGVAYAAIDDVCTIPGVGVGACLPTAACLNGGGGSFPGHCPNDPADVRCCYKRCPDAYGDGWCQPVRSCVGRTLSGWCPGSANVKCCIR